MKKVYLRKQIKQFLVGSSMAIAGFLVISAGHGLDPEYIAKVEAHNQMINQVAELEKAEKELVKKPVAMK